MPLTDIYCQDSAISILQKAYATDHSAHAYIFAGRDGIGRFTTAREWAKLLLCQHPITTKTGSDQHADSCGACESCRLFDAGSHPDFVHVYKELLEFTREGKGKTTPVDLSIDVIREFVVEKAPIRPALSGRKVFVVSEAQKLNAASQNALLKTLEEPPAYCSIVLLCTRLDKLLATTRSRCQIIRFGPIDGQIISERLKQLGLADAPAEYFARLAQGSLGAAFEWARLQEMDRPLYEIKQHIVRSVASFELADTLDLAQSLLGHSKQIATAWAKQGKPTSKTDINRKAHKTVIEILIWALHDAMTLALAEPAELVNFDQADQIKQLAARFETSDSAQRIAQCYTAMRWIEAGVNEKLIFEHLLLNLTPSAIIAQQG